ncbi:MAG: hypothetical protein M1820_003467 [Bogoriella megaspora]|nr:MAG: hypothetical protein M1820_003467 [Bogoriella megaspora]
MTSSSQLELIVVCCHSIYLPSQTSSDPTQEASWQLASFQRSSNTKSGEHETFLLHMLAALFLLVQRPEARLVISGGPTARSITDASEAQSYFDACQTLCRDQHLCFGSVWPQVQNRIFLEENATDSFQNLLFSIIAFRKRTGSYPQRTTVITHSFKAPRFLRLHAAAIGWPRDNIAVQGINPPFPLADWEDTEKGEEERAYSAFERSPFGADGALARKRIQRGWDDSRLDDISQSLEPSVQEFLKWKGGATRHELFPGSLPWSEKGSVEGD